MDPIANMLVSIRNAQAVKKQSVDIPYSVIKHNIADILAKKEFIESAEKKEKKNAHPTLFIVLKYDKDGSGAISHTKRISKPGRRMYTKKHEMKKVQNGYGIGIVSTSAGIMTLEDARKNGVGGEVICEVW